MCYRRFRPLRAQGRLVLLSRGTGQVRGVSGDDRHGDRRFPAHHFVGAHVHSVWLLPTSSDSNNPASTIAGQVVSLNFAEMYGANRGLIRLVAPASFAVPRQKSLDEGFDRRL